MDGRSPLLSDIVWLLRRQAVVSTNALEILPGKVGESQDAVIGPCYKSDQIARLDFFLILNCPFSGSASCCTDSAMAVSSCRPQ